MREVMHKMSRPWKPQQLSRSPRKSKALWIRKVTNAYYCVAAKSDDDIVDETILQSSTKYRSRSKSRKVLVSEALMCSDSEDELPRPQPSKLHRASPASLRAGGHAKYFRRNSNWFLSITARRLQPARERLADVTPDEGEGDKFKTARQETTRS
jgi:hypothetical protein